MCVQASFSEDGLSRLWNELVRDGEIANEDRRDEEELKDRKSPFDALLEEWTWGQVCVWTFYVCDVDIVCMCVYLGTIRVRVCVYVLCVC